MRAITEEHESGVSRRDLLATTVVGAAAAAGLQAGVSEAGAVGYPRVRIASVAGLKVNRAGALRLSAARRSRTCCSTSGAPCRRASGPKRSIVAFSILCQHMGCPVDYRRGAREFVCPCHQTRYDPERLGVDHPGRRDARRCRASCSRCATAPSTRSASTASSTATATTSRPARASEVVMSEHRRTQPEATRRQAVARGRPAPARCRSRRSSSPARRSAAAAGARGSAMALFLGQDELPVPPQDAKVHTSACQYCNVGCGYKIYTWPVDRTRRRAHGP